MKPKELVPLLFAIGLPGCDISGCNSPVSVTVKTIITQTQGSSGPGQDSTGKPDVCKPAVLTVTAPSANDQAFLCFVVEGGSPAPLLLFDGTTPVKGAPDLTLGKFCADFAPATYDFHVPTGATCDSNHVSVTTTP